MATRGNETKDRFDFLKSKIKELHIPLPNFEYFHKPSSEEEVFHNFIGREDISEKLEEWLTIGDSGAYLVTGYRGMGKSSFVGKVLNKITRKRKNNGKVTWFTAFCTFFITSIVISFFIVCNGGFNGYELGRPHVIDEWLRSIPLCLIVLSCVLIIGRLFFDFIKRRIEKIKRWVVVKEIEKTDYEEHKTWFEKVYKIKDIKESKHNLVIKLNLGHENLKEKDILSLIAKRIYETYKGYLDDFYTNWLRIITKTVFLFFGAILIVWFLDKINVTSIIMKCYDNSLLCIVKELCEILIADDPEKYSFSDFNFLTTKIIVKAILSIVFYFIVKKIYNFIVLHIPFLHKHSPTTVLEQLRFLIDRIEAAVTEDSGPNSGYTHSTSLLSFNFSRRKNKIYPSASTREIEDELIQILEKIQVARSLWAIIKPLKNLHRPPKFIIVFDELDKIDPVYNHVIKVEQDIPEFEASTAFQGGSAIRNRKQNVLKLLGNMKLFMSQVKAKFIFISGRELYDAFLADLADREFAASSIFNGVIYVDSFLRSSKQKSIITQTEEYISRYLIPKKWYRKEAKKAYEKARKDTPSHKLHDTAYRSPNLRMYKKFLIETLIIENIKKNKHKIEELSAIIQGLELENYDAFEHSTIINKELVINAKELFKNDLPKIEQIYLFIDKVIVFLDQFSIYLTHVCNGSPKKITIYFEQYVKTFFKENPDNPFFDSDNKKIKHSTYCLSFDATDQQNIGFINYMTYPIIQAVVNNSSHFGDKMLVSVSFLIDHIFKHHKGGFSNENIEHTPELLEVYHIPHLRNLIDTILSFLKQNHVTNICGGIYQYKFRKSIADEILYNSRISEEISAIFNFTLDESLSVKRYYYKQIETNEKKYLALEERISRTAQEESQYSYKNQYATTLVSQLEVLAEIHLLDEEHNEAIQHFQTAFDIIKSELQKCKDDKNKLHLYVLLNRTALKLGLSKECKGYHNEAFAIYNTLLDYLTGFRKLHERELGLYYFYEDNDLVTEKRGEWTAKKVRLFHPTKEKDRENILAEKYEDYFHENEVLPFYRYHQKIQEQKIDFLIEGDYVVSGLSKVLSPQKQEIISRLTLFSEVKPIFQAILSNLFVIEKIDVSGITQENLDLAEDQFKYLYLFTDSKDKFIQAADFYKKLASILFLKNYSNPKLDEQLQMWGFDIYEIINEFCFIYSDNYNQMIAGKFPKEILKEFFIDRSEDLLEIYLDVKPQQSKIRKLIKKYIEDLEQKYDFENSKKIPDVEIKKAEKLIEDFIFKGMKKRRKYFEDKNDGKYHELNKCKECYKNCSENREKNHPCYACNYVSKSLDIFKKVFEPKLKGVPEEGYKKRKSYFFKLLEYFKQGKTNSNHFFVLASALRIKADTNLSCINNKDNDLSKTFLSGFFGFLENYYEPSNVRTSAKNEKSSIENFIEQNIEKGAISKLEKTILYYWLSAEYFYLNNSLVDSNESLTKILIIFDKYVAINKEIDVFFTKKDCAFKNPFDKDIFEKIQNTIVRRVLRNSNITNDEVNHIELQNLKFILRNRANMRLNLSNLSTTADIEETLFSYCKLELASADSVSDKNSVFFLCYKSTLSSQYNLLSTIHEKILSLEFKERMNMAILGSILENTIGIKELNFYSSDFQIAYFSFLAKYIQQKDDKLKSFEIFKKIGIIPSGNISNDTKIRALNFLISDSLYCLTQIIEIVSSSKFSNYSHSFIGDIYLQLSKWATLYRLTGVILPQYKNIGIFKDHEIKMMWNRKQELKTTNAQEEYSEFGKSKEIKSFKKNITTVSEELNNPEIITYQGFEDNILNDIGTGNRHFLVPNYSIAMALKHYHKAIDINSEGKEYKEMIRKMYIIDDDISNGMHNFSLALERYTMNCEVIQKRIDILQKMYKHSLSYSLKNYLKDMGE